MLSSHFAPAILAQEKRLPKEAVLYFLIASQWQDLLCLGFHYPGLETTLPSDAPDSTLERIALDMLYRQDLYPQMVWLFFNRQTKIGRSRSHSDTRQSLGFLQPEFSSRCLSLSLQFVPGLVFRNLPFRSIPPYP